MEFPRIQDRNEELKVLILEDNKSDYELIKIALIDIQKAKFDNVNTYESFREKYETGEYNLILSDFNVPGVATIDILKEVRSTNKLIPFIFVSGTIGEEQAVELLKMGATDYVLKDNLQKLPFTLKRAFNELNSAIAEELALEALKENEKKFRNIIENAPDATLLISDSGEIQFSNKQATNLFGYSNDEFLNLNIENLVPKRFREKHHLHQLNYSKNPTARIMGEGMNYLFALKKDGSEFPIDISISPISKTEYGDTLTICSIRDITNRRKAEQEILKKKELLKEAQKLAKVGSWEWELKTNLVEWSDELYNIVGIPKQAEKHKFDLLFEYMHPDDRKALEQISRFKIKNEDKLSSRFRIYTPNGELKYLKSIENQTLDKNGNIILISGTIQDITDLVLAEKEKRELQKRTLTLLEEKVAARTTELFEANKNLEYQNNQITDSINYALNIQKAILNDELDCSKLFKDSFVLWKPKDVVSGDFFWVHSDDNYDYLAVADCTGHGVPGAFMSIISNQNLQRLLVNEKITQPKEILQRLNEALVTSLNQKTGMVNDGMDICFVRLDKTNNKIIFAGAQRPLLFFNGEYLTVHEGSKEGIGGYLSENATKEFDEIEIPYKKGDIIYLTSDGFNSQFGGENGKKMMKKRMENFIISIAHKSMNSQKKELDQFYKKWQGKEEQVDDVLVIGVKL